MLIRTCGPLDGVESNTCYSNNWRREKEFALQWLEHLLEYKLPMKEWANTKNDRTWNKPKLNRKPKQILQESINGLEDSYPMITKLCAHEDEIDLWPDFLNASLVGSSAEKTLMIG